MIILRIPKLNLHPLFCKSLLQILHIIICEITDKHKKRENQAKALKKDGKGYRALQQTAIYLLQNFRHNQLLKNCKLNISHLTISEANAFLLSLFAITSLFNWHFLLSPKILKITFACANNGNERFPLPNENYKWKWRRGLIILFGFHLNCFNDIMQFYFCRNSLSMVFFLRLTLPCRGLNFL